MKKFYRFQFFLFILILSVGMGGCSFVEQARESEDVTLYTGPSGHVGPVNVALTGNSRGEVSLSGEIAAPLVGNSVVGADWVVGFEKTLVKAEETSYHLYLLWEDENGNVQRDIYQIGQAFQVNFTQEEWVRKIATDSQGNIVVFVERDQIIRYYTPARSDSSCKPTFPARLNVGGQATVVVFQVKVRTEPGVGASLVEQKYFKRDRVLEVLEGPACKDGWLWWHVYSDELGYDGWVAEADHENYFLSP
jgi:hypothetical protein